MRESGKFSNLHGTSRKQIDFHSNGQRWISDTLDEHEIIDHLKLTCDQFYSLLQCPIHHSSSCDCLQMTPNKNRTISLAQALRKRCQLIRQLTNKSNIVLSKKKKRLLNRFDNQNEDELFTNLHI